MGLKGPDGDIQFRFRGPISSCAPDSSDDHRDRLSKCSSLTFRELISNTLLEGSNREELEKATFLFDDSILVSKESLFEEECKWLRQVGNVRMFILEIGRSCLLTYL